MNPYGNNYIFVGKKNSGKTHESLMLGLEFRKGVYRKINKAIVVFDHANNRSYEPIKKVIPLEALASPLKDGEIVKVQTDDIDTFCDHMVKVQKNCVVNIDEAGVHFSGTLSKSREAFLKCPKNNGHEIFYQYHYFTGVEMPPPVIKMTDIFVIKETNDDYNNLPDKVHPEFEIAYSLFTVYEMNKKEPINQKWSTVYFDKEADKIGFKKNGKIEWIEGDDFFPKRKKGEFKL